MPTSSPTAFARCPAVILFEEEGDNMASDWVDFIVCSRTKRGDFAVYGRKWAEEYSRGRYMKRWFTIFSRKGIRTPAGLVSDIKDCEVELSVDVYWPEIIVKLEKLDSQMGQAVDEVVDQG